MRTVKLVIGILSCVLVLIVMLQSCAAGVVTSIEQSNDLSGAVGVVFAIALLAAGITAIAGRNSKGGTLGAGILYAIGAIIGMTSSGIYADLQIWGGLSAIFAIVFLISLFSMRQPAPATTTTYTPEPKYSPAPGNKTVYTAPESQPTYTAPEQPSYDSEPTGAQITDFDAVPIRTFEAEKPNLIVKCLRVLGYIILIVSMVSGITAAYFFFPPIIKQYFKIEPTYCSVIAIAIGAIGSSIVGFGIGLPILGLALAIDDLHALRIYNSGYAVTGRRK